MSDLARPPREAYRDALLELMAADASVYCIDTDTGLFNDIDFGASRERYVNLGIAEQNLMGVAAGLAASGKRPFVHTLATFAATRALEQVKVDIAYNALPVRIVCTHAGFSAGHLGPTHHALEDIATLRVLPNMTVVVPADATQAAAAAHQANALPGPVYVRLGRGAVPALTEGGPLRIGTPDVIRTGKDATILACGPHPIQAALAACDMLRADGIQAAVVNVHTVKPLDRAALLSIVAGRPVVTVEEHWTAGGFGGAIAELVSEAAPNFVWRIGVDDVFASGAGDPRWLLQRHGITAQAIAKAVRTLSREVPKCRS
ncbi:transketolase family protein [Pendulispora albinea]|uniref:Transketolase family protein n=1 Tax=Pendulispora albinea TaxID=2741071 RepID=A0ABZ2LR84_9BACT